MSAITRRMALQVGGGILAPVMMGAASARCAAQGPAKPRIKIGQIGVGHAHATKLGVYRRSADYEVVGIVEPDAKLRARVQMQAVYRDLPWLTQQQLLETPGLQAVLVETRVRDLLHTAEACIAADKHVHLDKPAGESWPQYQRLLGAAERRKLLVQMGYMFRYNPAVILLREFLARDWLGEVFEVHAVMSKVVDQGTRRELGEYRGGIMFELGCHVIDLVVGVLGAPQKVTPFARQFAKDRDALVDNMLAVLEYDRALATVRSTAMEIEGFARRHLVVCGSEGTFQIQPLDNPRVRVALSQPRGEYRAGHQEIAFPEFTRYVDDAADMARIIRGEKVSDFPYRHDLAVQKTVLTASGLSLSE